MFDNICQTKNICSLKVLYLTLVRPIIFFATVICFPYFEIHQGRIQNKFLRFPAWRMGMPWNRFNHDYNEIRAILKIPQLSSMFHRTVFGEMHHKYKFFSAYGNFQLVEKVIKSEKMNWQYLFSGNSF